MLIEVLEEYRRGSLAVFLEKTSDALDWGAYRVKAVRIRRFTSEDEARKAYERTIHPRLTREAKKTTNPKDQPQNRRRAAKNENR